MTWVYGLLSNTPGNYIKKPIEQCSGQEIVQELMYHLGVPEEDIKKFSEESCVVTPVYMPFITSYFMLREPGDRPLVIPNGSENLAFIGNFAETERDTVFTTEYSVRTAMVANTVYYLSDRKKLSEMDLPFVEKKVLEHFVKKVEHTYIGDVLKDNHLL